MVIGKPVFTWENVQYRRDEKRGYVSVLSKDKPEYHIQVMNRSAKEIMELCDGSRTVNDIKLEMTSKYQGIARKQIDEDVDRTIVVLDRYGFIHWDGPSPLEAEDDEPVLNFNDRLRVIRGEDRHFETIKDFFYEFGIPKGFDQGDGRSKNGFLSPHILPVMYIDIELRRKLIEFHEGFYLLIRNSDCIGLLGLLSHQPVSFSMMEISVILLRDGISISEGVKCLIDALKVDLNDQLSDTVKIKCSVRSPSESQEYAFAEAIKQEGFLKEATLKDELGLGIDEIIYVWLFNSFRKVGLDR